MFWNQAERLQQQIRRRLDRLAVVQPRSFPQEVRFLLQFMDANILISGIIQQLLTSNSHISINSDTVFSKILIYGTTEEEHAAISYRMLLRWASIDNPKLWWQDASKYAKAEPDMLPREKNKTAQGNMIGVFIEPLCVYILDSLDDNGSVLAILRRYKQRCEWFHRDRLLGLIEEDSRNGEKKLASDLYEYLFDNGVSFTIEPRSASGQADLIGQQDSNDPLVADAKIFNPSKKINKGRSYLIGGFNQVYIYTRDYNVPFGYMVIFRTCEKDLKFDVSGSDMPAPYVTHNGKTIFLVVIDIHKYKKTASKRGPEHHYVISEPELIAEVKEGSCEQTDCD